MDFLADSERLEFSYAKARRQLLSMRRPRGCWAGELSSSPLATAAAISALVLAERHVDNDSRVSGSADDSWLTGVLLRNELSELVGESLTWLASRQNPDGGWGDAEGGPSNPMATLLVESAFRLTGVPARYAGVLENAERYVQSLGGWNCAKRGRLRDKTMHAAVLSNCALADLIGWRKTPSVYPESLLLPLRWRRRFIEAGACWADAARAVIGQARLTHLPPKNPLTRIVRRWACSRSLRLVEQLQGKRGGFLESPPVTSFLVMNLASVGLFDHAIVRRGIEYLLATVRRDASWSIGARPSVLQTSQAATALNWEFDDANDSQFGRPTAPHPNAEATLKWLLARQRTEVDPVTQAAAGGWARHAHSTGLSAADATAASLIALAAWRRRWPEAFRDEVRRAGMRGCDWLLQLQNGDGGWATFSRGAGRVPASLSAVDVTALALRALNAWRRQLQVAQLNPRLEQKLGLAMQRGSEFLKKSQASDGSWEPAWAVDAFAADSPNQTWGTCQAMLALEEIGSP
ncbi:MAG: hypothetical protein KDA61_01415, partial [Planctomycetales bacterium]|nr:hypothetical protein [Planctomycetales bacterium]